MSYPCSSCGSKLIASIATNGVHDTERPPESFIEIDRIVPGLAAFNLNHLAVPSGHSFLHSYLMLMHQLSGTLNQKSTTRDSIQIYH